MGEKSMLEHFWIVEQKASTATLLLSKPMASCYYHYRTPFIHETLMARSTPKE